VRLTKEGWGSKPSLENALFPDPDLKAWCVAVKDPQGLGKKKQLQASKT